MQSHREIWGNVSLGRFTRRAGGCSLHSCSSHLNSYHYNPTPSVCPSVDSHFTFTHLTSAPQFRGKRGRIIPGHGSSLIPSFFCYETSKASSFLARVNFLLRRLFSPSQLCLSEVGGSWSWVQRLNSVIRTKRTSPDCFGTVFKLFHIRCVKICIFTRAYSCC